MILSPPVVAAINADPALHRWGRLLHADVLLQAGPAPLRASIHDGRITAVANGPAPMPSWTVAFRADPAAWSRFLSPTPEPGFHDIMALVKRRALSIEGDLRPFMRHIFWWKGMFAHMRGHAP